MKVLEGPWETRTEAQRGELEAAPTPSLVQDAETEAKSGTGLGFGTGGRDLLDTLPVRITSQPTRATLCLPDRTVLACSTVRCWGTPSESSSTYDCGQVTLCSSQPFI